MHDDDMPGKEPTFEPPAITNPILKPIDKVLTWQTKREQAKQQAYINDPARLRRILLGDVAWFLGSLVLIIVENFLADGSMLDILVSITIGFIVGRSALKYIQRAQAYRNGWLDGRMQMIAGMTEAINRGFTIEEWLETELERDQSVMRYL